MKATPNAPSSEVGADGVRRTWVRWPLGAISLASHGDQVILTCWAGPPEARYGHRLELPQSRVPALLRALELARGQAA